MIHHKPVNRKIKLLKDVVHALGFKTTKRPTQAPSDTAMEQAYPLKPCNANIRPRRGDDV